MGLEELLRHDQAVTLWRGRASQYCQPPCWRSIPGHGAVGLAVVILVGSAILGVVVLRMHLLPWWCGALLIVAFPVGHFANALFASAENILLALLWGSVGVSLLVRATAPVEPTVGQSTRVS